MTTDSNTGSIISPDGRFELRTEEFVDRFDRLYYSRLIDRADGELLFECQGTPTASFSSSGILCVQYPGYEPGGIQINPVQAAFRIQENEPWIPLTAWHHIEFAYNRGWGQALDFRRTDPELQFPWVEILLLCACLIAFPIFCIIPFRAILMQVSLLSLSGLGVLFFGWLTGVSFRAWASRQKIKQAYDLDRRNRLGAE